MFVAQDGRRRSLKAGSRDVAEEVAKRLTIKLADDPAAVFKAKEKPKPKFTDLSNRDRTQVNLLGDSLLNPAAPNLHPESTKAVTP